MTVGILHILALLFGLIVGRIAYLKDEIKTGQYKGLILEDLYQEIDNLYTILFFLACIIIYSIIF